MCSDKFVCVACDDWLVTGECHPRDHHGNRATRISVLAELSLEVDGLSGGLRIVRDDGELFQYCLEVFGLWRFWSDPNPNFCIRYCRDGDVAILGSSSFATAPASSGIRSIMKTASRITEQAVADHRHPRGMHATVSAALPAHRGHRVRLTPRADGCSLTSLAFNHVGR